MSFGLFPNSISKQNFLDRYKGQVEEESQSEFLCLSEILFQQLWELSFRKNTFRRTIVTGCQYEYSKQNKEKVFEH